MRRGDLAQYPLDGMLDDAARDRVSGAIELHTASPAVLFVHDGRIYMALRAGESPPSVDEDLDDRQYQAALVAEEIRQRAKVVEILGEQITQAGEGYYFHQPLIDHPLAGAWGWSPSDLYAEAAQTIAPNEPAVEETPADAPGADGDGASAASADDDLPFTPVAPGSRARLGSVPPQGPVAEDAWALLRDLVGTRTLDDLLAARGDADGLEAAAYLRDCGLIDVIGPAAGASDPDDEDGDDAGRGERRRRWGR